MINAEWTNIAAIKDCTELLKKYPLEECLTKCQTLCESLDDEHRFQMVLDARNSDHCLRAIVKLVMYRYGARNLFAALLYLAGDVDGHQIQLQAYKYDTLKAAEELRRLLGG